MSASIQAFIHKPRNMLEQFSFFIRDLYNGRWLIIELTKNDFKTRYLGSYLGLLWAFVNPAIMIFIFWFVFQVGFKAKPIDNFPFILWLISGIIPWFFFSESLATATSSVMEKSFLVKKVVFRVSTLPVIKILSALIIHLFFVGIIFVMFLLYGFSPHLYNIQLVYYLFAMIFFVLGLSWITSSLNIFLKDVGQVVGVLLQFGFWLTPVFWSLDMVPKKYQYLIKLNPVHYLINGYRDSLIYKVGFWHHYKMTPYFWIVTSILFVTGAVIFRKVRPHFADVL